MAALLPYSRFNTPVTDIFNVLNELANTEMQPRTEIAPSSFMMDVQENPDGYVVDFTMPGVTRDEIDVELNEGHLNVSVNKQDSEEVSQRNYIHRETSAFRAMRSVYLKDADTVGLTAQLRDGILTVSVPKRTQDASVTKIQIG